MQWHESDVDAYGLNIHVYRSGGVNGNKKPPFILLHGATDNGLCWPRVAEALAQDYDLIALDARGHGLSDKPETGYSRDDHARDVSGVIQALKLDKPIVAGHSMGANTAAMLAATYPELVGAVILEDPPWRERTVDASPEEFAAERRKAIADRKQLPVEEINRLGKIEYPKWADIEFEHWGESKLQVSENLASAVTPYGFSWHDAADFIHCPALLLIADTSQGAMTEKETAAEIAEANSNIVVRYVPDAGHNIRRDQFDAYMQAVREFLAGL